MSHFWAPIRKKSLRSAVCVFAAASYLLAQGPDNCSAPKEMDDPRPGRTPAQIANLKGTWFARQGNYPCAIAAFESALRAGPDLLEARYNLGLALLEDRQLQRAARELDAVVKSLQGRAEPHLALALVLEEIGDMERAESELRTAAQTDPRSASIQHQ